MSDSQESMEAASLRAGIDGLIRVYSVLHAIPNGTLYRVLYNRFSKEIDTNIYAGAKREMVSQMKYIEIIGQLENFNGFVNETIKRTCEELNDL